MNQPRIARQPLHTARLTLRPTECGDINRACAIQSDWDVARMLRMASFPPRRDEMAEWISDHPRQWITGEAYRFAVLLNGTMIGLVDIDEISGAEGELGYWFDQAFWGCGYAFEAAEAMVRLAFSDLGLSRLKSGHADDNPASGRLLLRLGFRQGAVVKQWSTSRGTEIDHRQYSLANATV